MAMRGTGAGTILPSSSSITQVTLARTVTVMMR
jgi:hypothetical protein